MDQKHNDKDLKVLLINIKEGKETIHSFISRKKYTSTVLLDEDGKVAEDYSVYGIPVSFLLDKQGRIVSRFLGNLNWESEKMVSLLQSMIDEQDVF